MKKFLVSAGTWFIMVLFFIICIKIFLVLIRLLEKLYDYLGWQHYLIFSIIIIVFGLIIVYLDMKEETKNGKSK